MAGLSQRFAAHVLRERKRKGWTQVELAEKAGYSVSMISMVERGVRSVPLDGLEKFARAFKTSATSLLE